MVFLINRTSRFRVEPSLRKCVHWVSRPVRPPSAMQALSKLTAWVRGRHVIDPVPRRASSASGSEQPRGLPPVPQPQTDSSGRSTSSVDCNSAAGAGSTQVVVPHSPVAAAAAPPKLPAASSRAGHQPLSSQQPISHQPNSPPVASYRGIIGGPLLSFRGLRAPQPWTFPLTLFLTATLTLLTRTQVCGCPSPAARR